MCVRSADTNDALGRARYAERVTSKASGVLFTFDKLQNYGREKRYNFLIIHPINVKITRNMEGHPLLLCIKFERDR